MSKKDTVFIHNTNPSERVADKKTRSAIASYVSSTARSRRLCRPPIDAPARRLAVKYSHTPSHPQDKGSPTIETNDEKQREDLQVESNQAADQTLQDVCFEQNLQPPAGIGYLLDAPNTYPVGSANGVPEAMKFFYRVFAINALNTVPPIDGRNPWFSQYFTHALQNPLLFKGLMAFLQSGHRILLRNNESSDPQLDKDMAINHQRVVSELRNHILSAEDPTDDSTILSIMCLIGLEYANGNKEAFHSHRTGLSAIVQLRGGVQNLGGKGFFKDVLLGLEALYTFTEKQDPVYSEVIRSANHYLSAYPYMPELCAVCTRIPKNFAVLARSQILSKHSIALVSEISSATSKISETELDVVPTNRNHIYVAEYLNLQDSRPNAGKYLCLALALYALEMYAILGTNLKTTDTMETIFDSLMDVFIAYAHQVDLALNGTVSSNIGLPLPIIFKPKNLPAIPEILSKAKSFISVVPSSSTQQFATQATPMLPNIRHVLPKMQDETSEPMKIEVLPDQINIYCQRIDLAGSVTRKPSSETKFDPPTSPIYQLPSNTMDQLLATLAASTRLRNRWLQSWKASKASLVGPMGVLPWMVLTDRVTEFLTEWNAV